MSKRARNKSNRLSTRETMRVVMQSEMDLAKRAMVVQADARWLDDVKARLPSTWARVSTVAVALDVSCTTVRQWCDQQWIVAVDYSTRAERAAWSIYTPSVIEFLRSRQGGKQQ